MRAVKIRVESWLTKFGGGIAGALDLALFTSLFKIHNVGGRVWTKLELAFWGVAAHGNGRRFRNVIYPKNHHVANSTTSTTTRRCHSVAKHDRTFRDTMRR